MTKSLTRLAIVLSCLASTAALAATGTTNAADAFRTGWYPDQAFLTPAAVSSPAFGQLYSTPITGQVYAQPLYWNGVLFVATEANWIYGIDPDSGRIMWSRSLGKPFNQADIGGCGDLQPTIGITGTPVIDEATNTAYFVAKIYVNGSSGTPALEMHAVDVMTGNERANFPVRIEGTAQNSSTVTFDALHALQRTGLLLLDGVVYAGFGSHCDIGSTWRGWIAGVSTSGVLKALWTPRANNSGTGASIWMSGAGLVSDGPGRILFTTGNGGAPTTIINGFNPPTNLGEAVVRVLVQADGTLKATNFFTPSNAQSLDQSDLDLASGGLTALPDAYFGTTSYPKLAVQVGKQGYLYLLNRTSLGGCKQGPGSSDAVIQKVGPFGGAWSRPSVWPGDGGWVIDTASDLLRFYQYSVDGTGKPGLTAFATSNDSYSFSCGSPVVTSDGTTNGSALAWVIWSTDGGGGTNARLRAYDAAPVLASVAPRWSAPIGTSSKFALPGIAKNTVFVGTRDGHLIAFGAPALPLGVTRDATGIVLSWNGGIAPYSLRRSENPGFTLNTTTLVDKQPQTTFTDPVLEDGKTYFYLVN